MDRRRKINIPLIKTIVISILGFGLGVGSGLTGIGAQIAAVPTVSFMLGFTPEISAGTGLSVALLAAMGALAGLHIGGIHILISAVVVLTLGAFTGAVAVGGVSQRLTLAAPRRIAQGISILLCLFFLNSVLHPRIGGLPALNGFFRTAVGVFVVGTICGGLSRLFEVSNGILVVPALVYVVGIRPAEAMALSIGMVAFSSILPTWSYSARQMVDHRYGSWMAMGGALGGLSGGYILGLLSPLSGSGGLSSLPVVAFCLSGMFLGAWAIWRAT